MLLGKWWGNQEVQPVLALHGVQDNAATFDRLAPLLHTDSFLALDIPGHGCSSHLPQGYLYNFMDGVCLVRFVIKDYFKWETPPVLLGHSFGSILFFVYAAIYPEAVFKYISIDCARHQMAVQSNTNISAIRNTIEKTISYEGKTPPDYTYEELLANFCKGRKNLISVESCKVLLSRGIIERKNGKFGYSRDVRIKLNALGRLTNENLLNLAPMIKCDHLSIQASNGVVKSDLKGDIYKQTVELIMKNSPKNKHMILTGNHHIHLDSPELVADEVNKFLSL